MSVTTTTKRHFYHAKNAQDVYTSLCGTYTDGWNSNFWLCSLQWYYRNPEYALWFESDIKHICATCMTLVKNPLNRLSATDI